MNSLISAWYFLLSELLIYLYLNLCMFSISTDSVHSSELHLSTIITAAALSVVSAVSSLTHHSCCCSLSQFLSLSAYNLNLNLIITITIIITHFYNDMGAAEQAVANVRIKHNTVYHNLLWAEQDYYYAQMNWHWRVKRWIEWLINEKESVKR